MEKIDQTTWHDRIRAQGTPDRRDIAFVCPICRTVQSMRSFDAVGKADIAENQVGFSCIGRQTNAGPHKRGEDPGRGCDWTLGGLLRLHDLEVTTDDGVVHPTFALASSEQAEVLAGQLRARATPC